MAWSKPTTNKLVVGKEESITLPSSAGVDYSSEITFLRPDPSKLNKYVTFVATVSTVSGTTIDIALYGAWTSGGTKFTLLDAPIADFTTSSSSVTNAGVVDLNAYPAPYYYLGHTVDADEDANTISYYAIYRE